MTPRLKQAIFDGIESTLGLKLPTDAGLKTYAPEKNPAEIRKAIYTTNAIESLNSVIRKAIKKRKLFPTDDSAKKVTYLAIQAAEKNGLCRFVIGS